MLSRIPDRPSGKADVSYILAGDGDVIGIGAPVDGGGIRTTCVFIHPGNIDVFFCFLAVRRRRTAFIRPRRAGELKALVEGFQVVERLQSNAAFDGRHRRIDFDFTGQFRCPPEKLFDLGTDQGALGFRLSRGQRTENQKVGMFAEPPVQVLPRQVLVQRAVDDLADTAAEAVPLIAQFFAQTVQAQDLHPSGNGDLAAGMQSGQRPDDFGNGGTGILGF